MHYYVILFILVSQWSLLAAPDTLVPPEIPTLTTAPLPGIDVSAPPSSASTPTPDKETAEPAVTTVPAASTPSTPAAEPAAADPAPIASPTQPIESPATPATSTSEPSTSAKTDETTTEKHEGSNPTLKAELAAVSALKDKLSAIHNGINEKVDAAQKKAQEAEDIQQTILQSATPEEAATKEASMNKILNDMQDLNKKISDDMTTFKTEQATLQKHKKTIDDTLATMSKETVQGEVADQPAVEKPQASEKPTPENKPISEPTTKVYKTRLHMIFYVAADLIVDLILFIVKTITTIKNTVVARMQQSTVEEQTPSKKSSLDEATQEAAPLQHAEKIAATAHAPTIESINKLVTALNEQQQQLETQFELVMTQSNQLLQKLSPGANTLPNAVEQEWKKQADVAFNYLLDVLDYTGKQMYKGYGQAKIFIAQMINSLQKSSEKEDRL